MSLRVAAAAYPAEFLPDWDAYARKLTRWAEEAAQAGAQVLVFPEYASLELVSLLPPELHHDVLGMRPALQALLPAFLDLHAGLAQRLGVWLVAGSYPVACGDPASYPGAGPDAPGERYVNRAYVFGPQGLLGHQDKLLMTRFEAEEWHISPGQGVRVFEGPGVRLGVAICYDSEFPHLARAQAEGGAEVLLVPSFTEGEHGFYRVRVGAQARALENQFYAVHAPLIADAPWTYAIETARGRAACYAPSDTGLPASGVLSERGWDEPGWLIQDLDLARIRALRQGGHVLLWRDRHAALERVTPAQVCGAPQPKEPVGRP